MEEELFKMTDIYDLFKELKDKKSYGAFDELRDSSFQNRIFTEADPRTIADYVNTIGEDDNLIIENFGEDSLEHLTYLNMFSDNDYTQNPQELQEQTKKQYNIPGRGENPTVTYGMLKQWIVDFCELNKKPLPKGFHGRNMIQLLGMYNGMQKNYDFSIDDILEKKEDN